jgi:hypothetical protein
MPKVADISLPDIAVAPGKAVGVGENNVQGYWYLSVSVYGAESFEQLFESQPYRIVFGS